MSPTVDYIYDPPNQADCDAITRNDPLPISDTYSDLYRSFTLGFEVTLSNNMAMTEERVDELAEKVQAYILPSLVGCNDDDIGRRRALLSISNTATMTRGITPRRQLALDEKWRYVIHYASVQGQRQSFQSCSGEGTKSNCRMVDMDLSMILKGNDGVKLFTILALIEESLSYASSDSNTDGGSLVDLLQLDASVFEKVILSQVSIDDDEDSDQDEETSASPSTSPTVAPVADPTTSPSVISAPNTTPTTDAPVEAPPPTTTTDAPVESPPTDPPTDAPSATPTKVPTTGDDEEEEDDEEDDEDDEKLTPVPTTKAPTKAPTKTPTQTPTKFPTKTPTKTPTKAPTKTPTKSPTKTPTKAPTKTPTKSPTKTPTKAPQWVDIIDSVLPPSPTGILRPPSPTGPRPPSPTGKFPQFGFGPRG